MRQVKFAGVGAAGRGGDHRPAALPLLLRSWSPRIVNVAGGLGCPGIMTDPDRWESAHPTLDSGSSETALVVLAVYDAKASPGIRMNAAGPSSTATDLDGHRGTQAVTEGAGVMVAYSTVGSDGPTGGFFDRHGVVPW